MNSVQRIFQPSLRNKFLVEIVGTFILVYAITSTAIVYSDSGLLGVIGIALVNALALTGIIYAIGYRSGAQVNPAVTIGLLVAKKIGAKESIVYIIAQIIGAVVAAAVVYLIFGSEISASLTLPSEDNIVRALILETVMTFTLVYVVLTTTTSKNFKIVPLAGLAIGFTLGFNVILGGPITGGSLNPARSFGPALIIWDFTYQWIYWVAPIAGGLIAAGVYRLLHTKEEQEEEKLPPN